jgi:hypothetical protein
MSSDTVKAIIAEESQKMGVPSWIPLTIANVESGYDPNSVGDNGTSFGVFQLHRGGLAPSSLSDAQLKDPRTNTQIALQTMVPAIQRGQALGLSGFQLLEYTAFTSAWPGNFGSIEKGEAARPDYVRMLEQKFAGDTTPRSSSPAFNLPTLSPEATKLAGMGLLALLVIAFIKS